MTILHPEIPSPRREEDRISSIISSQRRMYGERGFLSESFALADPAPLSDLLQDVTLFDSRLAEWQARGQARVPYLFTPAIERIAHDPTLVGIVESLLGTDEWVVWGPNLLRETPNASTRWHVDIESRYWESVSVAVGVHGCTHESSIWCLPGTHRLKRSPSSSGNDGNTAVVQAHARRSLPDGEPPEQIKGFGDARFYVFNARTWHRAIAGQAHGIVLFLHYQRADALRIPLLLDYRRHRWSQEPTPHRASPGTTPVTATAPIPIRERLLGLVTRWLP